MTAFRAKKKELKALLLPPAWEESAETVPCEAARLTGRDSISPLIALLPRGGLLMWRAAILCGMAVARLAEHDMESARVVMRRLLWHLNEDSGNMGWGIPQTFGEIMAASPRLASEYGRIALSYVRDTGFADNYIDHDPLRRGAYWAIGRFAPLRPEYRAEGKELLASGLNDEDAPCRAAAAWGLGNFARNDLLDAKEKESITARLAKLPESGESCEILEGLRLYEEPAFFFTRQALRLLQNRL